MAILLSIVIYYASYIIIYYYTLFYILSINELSIIKESRDAITVIRFLYDISCSISNIFDARSHALRR